MGNLDHVRFFIGLQLCWKNVIFNLDKIKILTILVFPLVIKSALNGDGWIVVDV